MVSRMHCGDADGIRLMPAARGPPDPPEQALRSMPVEACTIERKQPHETADVSALLEGQCPVHVGLAGIQFGVEGEFHLKSTVM